MKKKTGFTLAEVLITLAIIGIIAALVIPAVMTNFQFRNVGVRLSKFMATVENATRAFVVADEALPSAVVPGVDANNVPLDNGNRAVIATYINNTFSITDAGASLRNNDGSPIGVDNIGLLPIDADPNMGGFMNALNVGPTPRDAANLQDNEVVLKDGTRAHFWRFNIPAATPDRTIWHNHTNPGVAVTGMPALGIIFDPIATIVPRSARRTFGYIITSQGFVFPAGVDQCLIDIASDRWETRQETFTDATRFACALQQTTDQPVNGN